ncbi:spindle pole body associated protein [Encephalitozoon intestinalis ATCC 50506]|uniref:Spindle pole body associated protein n=1 Tax=Encephalitozoon intestinalis (strain ATCC 50506) TaxID=876142 RepID=E0SA25_ENCIT|nr:spindle pole body associated protein [Encephalitozoon intestinalis ATCC 50506]ADM12647.1 spindle pole body associated protein [Encephalitozoon intestinalis ATCC 50506]UTX46507.1 Sun domain-containing protein 1 [Encephalitozoon intestinalis]
MNRRDRLQVKRTPDSTLNLGMDETIILQAAAPKARANKSVEPMEGNGYGQERKGIKDYPIYMAIAIPYVLFFYMAIKRPMDSMILTNLMEEINILREENSRISSQIEMMKHIKEVNYAKIEEGARIRIESMSQLFSYGFLGFRKHKEPSTIFDENVGIGECLAFKGAGCKFSIDLEKEAAISKIGLYHPVTKDTSSAIREFEVFSNSPEGNLLLGRFEYDTSTCGFQTFEWEETPISSVEIVVRSNGGNKKYTCIYKVYLFGNK